MTGLADAALIAEAQAFALPLLESVPLQDGENAYQHAIEAAAILRQANAPVLLQAAMILGVVAQIDEEAVPTIEAAFGTSVASLVHGTKQLAKLEATARTATSALHESSSVRTERVRRMLLAFSRDLRGVLLHLASRLQSMRWHVQQGIPYPPTLAQEALTLLAPLANRLGVWSLKWELEDLAFRTTQPEAYAEVARAVEATREQRMQQVAQFQQSVVAWLATHSVQADVAGRAKHLYSVWRKMQGKHLRADQVLDLRAIRIVVADVAACYGALAQVHSRWKPLDGEFDDYIASPKINGYQSLHTVVLDDFARPIEVQIRTRAMHEHAEHGVAAHWAYKEAGAKGYAGVNTAGSDAQRVAGARKAMLQQLLAWEQDVVTDGDATTPRNDRVYVFTPQGAVIDLPSGATAVDFAYNLHTAIGHRCRGAKLDGTMVALNTPLKNGQTVEVVVGKEGGPSLDWLNPELGFLASARSRTKVRAWFNEKAHAQTVAKGRDRLERTLQRLGRTTTKHNDVATLLHLADAEALYSTLGKDELPLRDVELLWQTAVPAVSVDESAAQLLASKAQRLAQRPPVRAQGDVLVVGVDSLLTALAKCCRPAPPDAIGGFVTRYKGVAIHRAACTNFRHMVSQAPARVCAVAWGEHATAAASRYTVDLAVEALDRPALLRDVSDVLAKERVNVVGVQSQTVHGARDRVAWMTFTVEIADASALGGLLAQINKVTGVRQARRK